MANVTVRMTQPYGPKHPLTCFEIKVESAMRAKTSSVAKVFPGHGGIDSPKKIEAAVFLAGVGAAEYLCEHHGDVWNPEEVGKDAQKLYVDLMEQMADAARK